MAVRRGSIEELARLAAAGVDVDARDEHGPTALMQAAVHGHTHVVEWLVGKGAELDHTAKYGLRALMLAVVNGHVAIVRILVRAGATLELSGTGAPGFAGKTALDIAKARGDQDIAAILETRDDGPVLVSNPHFAVARSWREAATMLTFRPCEPLHTAGCDLQSLRIHIRDHKLRDVAIEDRTLEARYAKFVVSQSRTGALEARRLAFDVSYGPSARAARIAHYNAHVYDLGPEPPLEDIDGRSPAVVTWADGEMFYLVASGEMSSEELMAIAISLYEGDA